MSYLLIHSWPGCRALLLLVPLICRIAGAETCIRGSDPGRCVTFFSATMNSSANLLSALNSPSSGSRPDLLLSKMQANPGTALSAHFILESNP